MYIFGQNFASSETFLRQETDVVEYVVRYVVPVFSPRKLGLSTSVWDRQVYD